MTEESTPAKVRLSDQLGAVPEARRFLVVWDDDQGLCCPMGWDGDCEGALGAMHRGKLVLFKDRKSARQAIRVSTAYAKLCKAQGKPANTDFLDGASCIKVVECESA